MTGSSSKIRKSSRTVFWITTLRWRTSRAHRLGQEEASDAQSRKFEEQEAENLRRESEAFLAKQMYEMQALADERKAGLLLDDYGGTGKPDKATVFSQEEEEEEEEDSEATKRRKVPLVKLDFSIAENGREIIIDHKFEPLVKQLMVKYLGKIEDDDLILFVEHLTKVLKNSLRDWNQCVRISSSLRGRL
ncbi:hypothetical protein K435DRAFT_851244 [Dendrothele bispora CBS 962.96]|uniref:PWI domain-containing protein n=1 Tax=Dendrothele bispora (strain CBS 962.96) TaxID=1314807 RepID=A0A4S8MMH6_DENBC|nr:hypothetical protein K435DRAFT_851244 [Dendrothele bispora CBS 962.96]